MNIQGWFFRDRGQVHFFRNGKAVCGAAMTRRGMVSVPSSQVGHWSLEGRICVRCRNTMAVKV